MTETVPIDDRLAAGARLMWVCAHPDDEFLTGALLARAAVHHRTPVHIVVLTRGDGGDNTLGVDDLGATRKTEMEAVAAELGATVEVHDFFNAPLPVSSFPPRDELFRIWSRSGDPVGVIRDAVRSFEPDIVVTFEPTYGATGHPEHQLASRLTTTAVAGMEFAEGAEPDVYYALRIHWFFSLLRQTDPGPVDEVFDGTLPCGDTGLTSHEMLMELLLLHRTQRADMGMYRRFGRFFRPLGLRRVDPASAPPPDEPV